MRSWRALRATMHAAPGDRRRMSSLAKMTRGAIYYKNGSPGDVLRLEEHALPPMGAGDIQVRMLAAPINPSDLNMIEGVYGIQPQLPSWAGNEGVGQVEAIGDMVSSIQVGDWVIPSLNQSAGCFGTWRTRTVCRAADVTSLSGLRRRTRGETEEQITGGERGSLGGLTPEMAAGLTVNPCTAFRLLSDFAALTTGDVVVQNGANSAVGQLVIQLARLRGLRTVNVVRDREPDAKKALHAHLHRLGADHIVTDRDFSRDPLRFVGSDGAKLALNCVGGKSAVDQCKALRAGGRLVVYGGMSRRPLMIGTSQLIFQDLSVQGFWLTTWLQQHSQEELEDMLVELMDLFRTQQLQLQVETVPLSEVVSAVQRDVPNSGKLLLVPDSPKAPELF